MTENEIRIRLAELEDALAAVIVLLRKLSAAIEAQSVPADGPLKPVQTPFKEPSNARSYAARYLRDHRPGRPSKIDSDPELRAFIVARIDTTTFTALKREVAKAFPPERRIGKSAIHNWLERNLKSILKSDPQ